MTDTPASQFRWWGRHDPRGRTKPPIVARQPTAAADAKVAEMRLYDPIDSWGGDWGVSAKEFAAAVDELPAGTSEIRLHINSPGGEAFEALAMLNTLRRHEARIVAVVDGLAASAASFLAVGADELIMGRNTELMVHEPRLVAIGTAADMADASERLNKLATDMAEIYAEKAGGGVESWRDVMRAEVWYAAQEAVDAGLADSVMTKESGQGSEAAKARWDLGIFAYAGRAAAPPPSIPAVSARVKTPEPAGPGDQTRRGAVADAAKLREALGLKADASDDEVRAAWASSPLAAQPNPPDPANPPAPPPDPAPDPKPDPANPPAPAPTASGTMTIDASAWQEREDRIKRLEAADAKRRRDERDQVIAQAVKDGKFATARAEHWVRLWDADPEGTRQVIAGLTKGVVPTSEMGHAGLGDDDLDAEIAEFEALLPPESRTAGKGR